MAMHLRGVFVLTVIDFPIWKTAGMLEWAHTPWCFEVSVVEVSSVQ